MAKQDTLRYRGLISAARQNEYYATCKTNGLSTESRDHYARRAQEFRAQAEALPDDFQDPPFQMPEWGTRGT